MFCRNTGEVENLSLALLCHDNFLISFVLRKAMGLIVSELQGFKALVRQSILGLV